MKIFLLSIFTLLFVSAIFSQDEEPPILHSITMVPDSAISGDSITIMMEISDDLAGVSGYGFPQFNSNYITYARVSDPDSNQAILIYDWIHTTGNFYYSKIKIPTYTPSGYWKVDYVYAVDTIGNFKIYKNNIDFNTSCYITSNAVDTIPPVLNSLSVIPNSANNGDTVLIRIDATDDLSGLSGNGFPNGNSGGNTIARFSNPYGIQEYYIVNWTHDTNNIYFGKAYIDQYAEAGTWAVDYITIFDIAGNNKTYYNYSDFNATVHVSSPGLDYQAPVLDSINILPNTIFRGDSVTIIMYARDNISGISGYGFPDGANGGISYAEINNNWDEEFITVTEWISLGNNTFQGKFLVPAWGHIGMWSVCTIYLSDQLYNDELYSNNWDFNGDFYVHDVNEGIDDIINENLISVFPNPVSDELYFRSELEINSIMVFSSTGQALKIFDNKNTILNFQDFDNGFYMLVISTSEGIISKKIIKN